MKKYSKSGTISKDTCFDSIIEIDTAYLRMQKAKTTLNKKNGLCMSQTEMRYFLSALRNTYAERNGNLKSQAEAVFKLTKSFMLKKYEIKAAEIADIHGKTSMLGKALTYMNS